jgi:hypothetical protein
MTDPRYTDPWYSDPPPDTGLPQGDSIVGPLDWIVGIAAVVLIAFAVFLGINHAINDGTHPATNKPMATTESAPNGGMKSPSTTGFGGSSPQPMSPPNGGMKPSRTSGFAGSSPQPMMSPPAQAMTPPTRSGQ